MVLPFCWTCSSTDSTRPTTIGPARSPPWIASSSRPTDTNDSATSAPVAPGARSVYSPSQLSGARTSDLHPELLGEPGVALDDVAHVGHAVAQLQRALDAQPEREPGVDVRVDAAGAQHLAVDHARAAELYPPRSATGPAGRVVAMADEADEVGLHARLGEREVRRPHPRPRALAEHHVDEVVDRSSQVRHGQALVDRQRLDLVEHRGMRRVEVVGPEHLARGDDVDRRGPLQHGPDLYRRGLGAQDETTVGRLDEEGVLHLAGRVVLAEVEGVEVHPLRLDLGALDDLPAHPDEGVHQPFLGQLQRVPGAGRAAVHRPGDVDGLLDEDPPVALLLELGLAARVRTAERGLRRAHPLAGLRLGARGEGPD